LADSGKITASTDAPLTYVPNKPFRRLTFGGSGGDYSLA